MRDLLASIGYNGWILPALLIVPLVGALALYLVPSRGGTGDDAEYARASTMRRLALVFFVVEFVLSAGLWWSFESGIADWQAVSDWPWIPEWGARFTVGIDGISLFMVLLTTLLMPLAVLGSWSSIRVKARSYYALLLVLTTGMIGVFVALDLLLFYVMWEVMLVPMYFIIGIWGGERRIYASLKFFIYTMVGSLLMLVAILYLWMQSGGTTFNYDQILAIAQTDANTFTFFGRRWYARFHSWSILWHVGQLLRKKKRTVAVPLAYVIRRVDPSTPVAVNSGTWYPGATGAGRWAG